MENNFDIENKEKELFSKLKPNYSKSKNEVWEQINLSINQDNTCNEEKKEKKVVPVRNLWLKYSIAASLLVLFTVGVSLRFYTTKIYTSIGETINHTLPDGSFIIINAATKIAYHPFWWKFNRTVKLEGEAFFEVKKGNKFTVLSENGTTEVLGTSFNIYCRDSSYSVLCKTGKVSVKDNRNNKVILEKGVFAKLKANEIQVIESYNSDEIISWKTNMFNYKNTSLKKVFEDFKLNYGVNIEIKRNEINKLHYTGLFKRKTDVVQALEIVCFSFDLNYEKIGENSFIVK